MDLRLCYGANCSQLLDGERSGDEQSRVGLRMRRKIYLYLLVFRTFYFYVLRFILSQWTSDEVRFGV